MYIYIRIVKIYNIKAQAIANVSQSIETNAPFEFVLLIGNPKNTKVQLIYDMGHINSFNFR